MGKIEKIGAPRIKKIKGGRTLLGLVEEFMGRRGFNQAECLQQKTSDLVTWAVPLSDYDSGSNSSSHEEEELELTLEGLSRPPESTIYLGVNILSVPLKDSHSIITAALTVADTLIGAKLSLVNYDIVLSITQYTSNLGVDDLDFYFELLSRQKTIMQEAILEELSS